MEECCHGVSVAGTGIPFEAKLIDSVTATSPVSTRNLMQGIELVISYCKLSYEVSSHCCAVLCIEHA